MLEHTIKMKKDAYDNLVVHLRKYREPEAGSELTDLLHSGKHLAIRVLCEDNPEPHHGVHFAKTVFESDSHSKYLVYIEQEQVALLLYVREHKEYRVDMTMSEVFGYDDWLAFINNLFQRVPESKGKVAFMTYSLYVNGALVKMVRLTPMQMNYSTVIYQLSDVVFGKVLAYGVPVDNTENLRIAIEMTDEETPN